MNTHAHTTPNRKQRLGPASCPEEELAERGGQLGASSANALDWAGFQGTRSQNPGAEMRRAGGHGNTAWHFFHPPRGDPNAWKSSLSHTELLQDTNPTPHSLARMSREHLTWHDRVLVCTTHERDEHAHVPIVCCTVLIASQGNGTHFHRLGLLALVTSLPSRSSAIFSSVILPAPPSSRRYSLLRCGLTHRALY